MVQDVSIVRSAGSTVSLLNARPNSNQGQAPPASATSSQQSQDSASFSSEAVEAQKTGTAGSGKQLTPQQQAEVQHLKQIDQQVHQHEQAHLAASGGYARGGASYSYTTGPDGKRYAIGGEVSIDVSTASTPQATVQKMETVEHAALAPTDPSPQDRAVYAEAQRAELNAEQEEVKQKEPGNAQASGGQAEQLVKTSSTSASAQAGASSASLIAAFAQSASAQPRFNIIG